MIKRRSFLTYFSVGWLASCFPVVLAACSPEKPNSEATASNAATPPETATEPTAADKGANKPAAKSGAVPAGFTAIGKAADLDKAGFLQSKTVSVTKDPKNPQQLIAVSRKCTHQGCDVKWMAGEKKYDCPCHDAEYAADGKVLKGPAQKPLTVYAAKIVGGQVYVKESAAKG